MLNTGQSKGFLSGIGTMFLCQNIIFPLLRGNMRSVAVRSMEEGLAMVDRAKPGKRTTAAKHSTTAATGKF